MNNKDSKNKNTLNELIEKYGEEKVNEAISMFGEKKQRIISMFFTEKKSINEISMALRITENTVYASLSGAVNKIEDLINSDKSNNLEKLYQEYGKELVDKAMSQLTDTNRKILSLYYGLEGDKPKSSKEIASILNISSNNVSFRCYYGVKRIKEIINFEKKDIRKDSKLRKLYNEYGKEMVDEEIGKLSDKNKRIIGLYYGFDNSEPKTLKKISEIMNISYANVTQSLHSSIKRIEKNLAGNSIEDKLNKLEKFYKMYGKEKVDIAIGKLGEKTRKIFTLYYGLDGSGKKSLKEVSDICNTSFSSVTSNLFKGFKRIEVILDNRNLKVKDLYAKYGEEKINSVINLLNEDDKEVMRLYFGLEDGIAKTIQEISEILGVGYREASWSVYSSISRIENYLNNKTINKINKYNVLCEKYGKENVNKAINALNEKNRKVINLYYGLDGTERKSIDEIANIINKDYDNVTYLLSYIHKKIEKIIIENKEKADREISVKLEREKRKKVLYNMLIVNDERVEACIDKLKAKERNLLRLYFAYDGYNVYSTKKISEKYNISEHELMKLIREILEKVNDELRKNLKKERKEYFNSCVKVKNKEKLKKILKKNEYEIVNLYYGFEGKVYTTKEISETLKIDDNKVEEKLQNIMCKISNSVKNRN